MWEKKERPTIDNLLHNICELKYKQKQCDRNERVRVRKGHTEKEKGKVMGNWLEAQNEEKNTLENHNNFNDNCHLFVRLICT